MSKVTVVNGEDWSSISGVPKDIINFIPSNAESECFEMLGLWREGNNVFSSGYVGVKRVTDYSGKPLLLNDKEGESEVIIDIHPRFHLDQWVMLSEVMSDDEYESYIAGNPDRLYKIFFDEPTIKTNTNISGGELLLAISFVMECNTLCKMGLKHQMGFKNENLCGRVRGSINLDKQIKTNLIKGKDNWIYCKYPEFTLDTIENRILKRALDIAKIIICNQASSIEGARSAIRFCETSFKSVKSESISRNDFSKVNVTGFNSKYKRPIELAKLLILHYGMNFDQDMQSEQRFVVPYVINMEAVFEFYIRSQVKKYLKQSKLAKVRLDKYRKPGDSDRLVTYLELDQDFSKPYLMNEYIPDILLQKENDNGEWINCAVFDVKYQHSMKKVNSSSRRHNTHQLLFYTLLLNTEKCGFLFPKETNDVPIFADLVIQNGNAKGSKRFYSQWGISTDKNDMDSMFETIVTHVLT